MALIEIKPIRGASRNTGKANKYLAVSSTNKKFDSKKGNSYQIVFYIAKPLMIEQRWMIGDRITVLIDKESGRVHLRRTAQGGYAISSAVGGGIRNKDVIGAPEKASISITTNEISPIPYTLISKADCQIIGSDLTFPCPGLAPVSAAPTIEVSAPPLSTPNRHQHVFRPLHSGAKS